ncbi:DNA-dependent helicase II [Slackia heliotrinireducens]|uniref:Uncharacterized protein n=1 Tax=Slackia heliotrinireducens (strain ATCC 29202 / DSM 20476 / NCTC 11029 / RHS 1) TaxID=471855 RepID=C7N160_SLAHD|nr:AAA family ATPase [Slackia heliotrinireducens]ACV23282.1 hypothetical protein Shel_22720 [Slackia heliotrinireducens DSM 20476]VEH02452.1 DNA-dependent helicase II [Slackia heliotrinireducens]
MQRLDMEQALAAATATMRVTAPVGAGKTEFLIRHACALVQNGLRPSSICLVVNSEMAKLAAKRRLSQTSAAGVRITTARELALQVLSLPEARTVIGRSPRAATKQEVSFILTDLRLTGIDSNTLRKVVADPTAKPDSPDGQRARDVLFDLLKRYDILLDCEVAPSAVQALGSLAEVPERLRFQAVLVDDYQNLSAASQALCEMMARERFVVAGNADQFIDGFDTNPNPRGLTDFETGRPDAASIELEAPDTAYPRIRAFAQAALTQDSSAFDRLVESGAVEPDDDHAVLVKWRTPADEMANLPDVVRRLLAAEEGLVPRDLCIVTPNHTWTRSALKMFKRAKIAATAAQGNDPLRGDPRRQDASGMLEAFVRAHLLADRNDLMAWRMWLGLGRRDLASKDFAALADAAQDHAAELAAMLNGNAELSADTPPELRARIAEGRALIARSAEKQGYSLIMACMPELDEDFESLVGELKGSETAAELAATLRKHVFSPVVSADPACVVITPYRQLQGLSPKAIVVLGAVEGLMPAAAQLDGERQAQAARRLFCNAVGKAQNRLVVSTFQKAPAAFAEQFRLVEKRRKAERGQTMAMLARTRFVDDAGNAAPPSQSGEQFV